LIKTKCLGGPHPNLDHVWRDIVANDCLNRSRQILAEGLRIPPQFKIVNEPQRFKVYDQQVIRIHLGILPDRRNKTVREAHFGFFASTFSGGL